MAHGNTMKTPWVLKKSVAGQPDSVGNAKTERREGVVCASLFFVEDCLDPADPTCPFVVPETTHHSLSMIRRAKLRSATAQKIRSYDGRWRDSVEIFAPSDVCRRASSFELPCPHCTQEVGLARVHGCEKITHIHVQRRALVQSKAEERRRGSSLFKPWESVQP